MWSKLNDMFFDAVKQREALCVKSVVIMQSLRPARKYDLFCTIRVK